MDSISVKALAKINLGLDVVRRREDGYHEVRMIMQTIHLYDRLVIRKTKEPKIALRTNLSFLPSDGHNLAYRAAEALREEFGIREGIDIELKKYIPVAAGMAGGSADAAAVLYGVNELFGLGLARRELMERGVKLGADVPYCLMRGTALAEGIGEKLTQLAPMVKCPVLIAKPPVSVSTKYVYEHLRLTEDTVHPDIDRLIADIKAGDLHQIAAHMGNILELVTIPLHPRIASIRDCMKENGAVNAMMSGSGPTVFGLFENVCDARRAAKKVREQGIARQIYVTDIYNNRRK